MEKVLAHKARLSRRRTCNCSSGSITTSIPVTSGKPHKLTTWIYLKDASGGTWGEPKVTVTDLILWKEIAASKLLQDTLPKNVWTKLALSFTPTGSSVQVHAGEFGDRTSVELVFDDLGLH